MKKSFGGMLVVVLTLAFVVLGCAGTPPVTTENVSQGKNFGSDAYQPYQDKSQSIDAQSYLLNLMDIESNNSSQNGLRYRITLPGTADNGRDKTSAVANAVFGAALGGSSAEPEPVGIRVWSDHRGRIYWLPPGERTFVLNEEQWELVGGTTKTSSTSFGETSQTTGGKTSMVANKELDRKTINLEAGHYYYLRSDSANRMVIEELTRDGGSIMLWDFKLKTEVEVPMSAVIDGIDANIAYLKSHS